MSNEPETEDSMVAALLRERESLVQRGLTDRVGQVDEQLELRGHKAEAAKKPAPERSGQADKGAAPAGRRAKPTSTAKAG